MGLRLSMKILAAFLLIPFCLAAAVSPGEVDSLIASARAIPPEFTADALLRISTLDAVDQDRKIELIEEAFRKGGQAQQHYKLRSAIMSMPGPVAFLNKVYQQDLDGLDLQLRAVEAMLPLDAARARKLFQAIPAIQLPPIPCDDFMVYDVDRFYQVMASAARSFKDPERAAGEPVRFLRPYATSVRSAVQIGPMAAVLAGSGVSDSDFKDLVNAFGGVLGKITGDDRSFTASYRVGSQIESLVNECKRRNISPLPLLEGYRLYLVVNLTAARCADNDILQGGTLASSAAAAAEHQVVDVVAFFNDRLRMSPLQPIQEEESTPGRLAGVATGLRSCTDEQCRGISDLYRLLVIGAGNMPLPPSDRNTPEWRNRLRKLLDTMAAWKPGTQTDAGEHYREKVLIYSDLLNLAPAGEARDAVLKAELDYIVRSRDEAAKRVEWFLPLNALMARMTLDPLGFGGFSAEMRKSTDPVVALYARLEAVAPRSPDRVIALL